MQKEIKKDAVDKDSKKEPKKDPVAITGFILGIISIFLGGSIGILPIATMIISGIGIKKTSPSKKDGRGLALIGLILGIIYFISYLNTYGYINL